jgi:hypothetical protein
MPCGCASQEAYDLIKNKIIQLSFSGFGFNSSLGGDVFEPDCGPCSSQIPSFTPSAALSAAWSSHFNNIVATLSFDSATANEITWRGESSTMSSPSGGTVKYFFYAIAGCGYFFVSTDATRGCQQNTGFTSLTSATATNGPISFAPGVASGIPEFVAPYTNCGSLSVPSGLIGGTIFSQVFCAQTEAIGCLGARECSNQLRWSFAGQWQATIVTNALP